MMAMHRTEAPRRGYPNRMWFHFPVVTELLPG
jgi:hypothetical protein